MYDSGQVYHFLFLYIKTLFRSTDRHVLHLEINNLHKGLHRAYNFNPPIPISQLDDAMQSIPYRRYSHVTTEMPLLTKNQRSIHFVPVDDYCYTVLFDEALSLRDLEHFRMITNLTEAINC